ncbi:addiction module antidote protein [Bradyrhizobium sp. USDA 3315]
MAAQAIACTLRAGEDHRHPALRWRQEATAIGGIAKARGVSQFAKETGLSREAIYKSFRPGGNPTIETVHKATKTLGLKLKRAPSKAD